MRGWRNLRLPVSHFSATIVTLPHKAQRYPTVGDWRPEVDSNRLRIMVSQMPDERYEFLVALHELIEAYLCKLRGISEESVTEFDLAHLDAEEPGNLEDAPYHREHTFATQIERLVSDEMGVDWGKYGEAVDHVGD